VLVLKRTSAADKLRAREGRAHDVFHKERKYILQNGWLQPLVDYEFNYLSQTPYPVINETGYNEKVDLELDENFSNLEALRKSLEKYDLALEEQERELEVIVLRR